MDSTDERFAELGDSVRRHAQRSIDLEALASLYNELICGPKGKFDAKDVTKEHIDRYARACGLNDEEIKGWRSANFRSGLVNPTATNAANLVSYGIGPLAQHFAGVPGVSAGIGALSAAEAVVGGAYQQTSLVKTNDEIKKMGPVKFNPAKKTISDRGQPIDFIAPLMEKVEKLGEAKHIFAETINEAIRNQRQLPGKSSMTREMLASAESPGALFEQYAQSSDLRKVKIAARNLSELDPEVRQQNLALQTRSDVSLRHKVNNDRSILPRSTRNLGSAVGPLLAYLGVVSGGASAALSGGIAIANAGASVLTAGAGEQAKSDFTVAEEIVNERGKGFTKEGQARLLRNEPINETHLVKEDFLARWDFHDLRLVETVRAAMRKTADSIESEISDTEKDIKALETKIASISPVSSKTKREGAALLSEKAGLKIDLDIKNMQMDQHKTALTTIREHQGHLEDFDFVRLRTVDELMQALNNDSQSITGRFFDKHSELTKTIKDAHTRKEYEDQFYQRVASAFSGGPLGPGILSWAPRAVTAIASYSLPLAITSTILSTGISFETARRSGNPSDLKNAGREQEKREGKADRKLQVKRGIMDVYTWRGASKKQAEAIGAVADVMADIEETMQMADALVRDLGRINDNEQLQRVPAMPPQLPEVAALRALEVDFPTVPIDALSFPEVPSHVIQTPEPAEIGRDPRDRGQHPVREEA